MIEETIAEELEVDKSSFDTEEDVEDEVADGDAEKRSPSRKIMDTKKTLNEKKRKIISKSGRGSKHENKLGKQTRKYS